MCSVCIGAWCGACAWHWRACGSPSSQGAQDPIMPFLAELRMDSGSGMECRTIAPYRPYSAMTLLRPQHFSRFRHFARRFWNHTWKNMRKHKNIKTQWNEESSNSPRHTVIFSYTHTHTHTHTHRVIHTHTHTHTHTVIYTHRVIHTHTHTVIHTFKHTYEYISIFFCIIFCFHIR